MRYETCERGFPSKEALYYPPSLSLTSTVELACYPILSTIRRSLFPNLRAGQYLIAEKDAMQLVETGAHACPLIEQIEAKVATLIIILPVQYRGGTLTVCNVEGDVKTYIGQGGNPDDLEWVAFLADCKHKVDTVTEGRRLTISYDILLCEHDRGGRV